MKRVMFCLLLTAFVGCGGESKKPDVSPRIADELKSDRIEMKHGQVGRLQEKRIWLVNDNDPYSIDPEARLRIDFRDATFMQLDELMEDHDMFAHVLLSQKRYRTVLQIDISDWGRKRHKPRQPRSELLPVPREVPADH